MTDAAFPDLNDASVFITGGGSGIGAALTDGFMAQGARVAFIQRSDTTAFLDEMERKHHRRPWFRPCDVTDIDDLQAAIGEASKAQGDITVLVNNAANDRRHATLGLSVQDWDALMAVNLRPFLFATQAVVPGMKRAGGGRIVNFSSISYMMGHADMPAYTAAKSGINAMTRGHAREFGPDNIRVNALTPGMVLTDRQLKEVVDEDAIASQMKLQCLKVRICPQDMVGPALFLASAASSVMTGQALVIDAGVVTTG